MAEAYRRVEKAQETLPTNEIRVKRGVGIGRYLKRAWELLNGAEGSDDTVVIKGVSNAVQSAVNLAELVKHRVKGLHQINKISNITIIDEYEPLYEGLDRLKHSRVVTMLQITLTKSENVDKSDVGYQPPIPEDEVQEYNERERLEGDRRERRSGRNARSGRTGAQGEEGQRGGGRGRRGGRGNRGGAKAGFRGGARGGAENEGSRRPYDKEKEPAGSRDRGQRGGYKNEEGAEKRSNNRNRRPRRTDEEYPQGERKYEDDRKRGGARRDGEYYGEEGRAPQRGNRGSRGGRGSRGNGGFRGGRGGKPQETPEKKD